MVVVIGIVWKDQSTTGDIIPSALKIEAAVRSTSVQARFPYANLADMYAGNNDTDQFAAKLYDTNYPRLQELKQKYDPDEVFSRWFRIKPAQ
jgi:hypothetical protein